jgi:hypothetical protein
MVGVKVALIESERGWGKKIDDYMVCLSISEAELFIKEYNSKNTEKVVPDWYMYADSSVLPIDLTTKQYNYLKEKGRVSLSELEVL